MNNLRDRLKNMKVPDIDDPEGCPLCGAIAGVCDNYPECKKDWPIDNLREQIIEIVLHSTCSANPEHWEPEYVADQILALLPQWISVEDKVPEEDGYFYVAFANGGCWWSWYRNGRWLDATHAIHEYGITEHGDDHTVIHWMPLPESPKEGE